MSLALSNQRVIHNDEFQDVESELVSFIGHLKEDLRHTGVITLGNTTVWD